MFGAMRVGLNSIPTIPYSVEFNEKPKGNKNGFKGIIISGSVGAFLNKNSFIEATAMTLLPHSTEYGQKYGGIYFKRSLNGPFLCSIDYGYRILLGKKHSGYFYMKAGATMGSASINDTLVNVSWQGNDASSTHQFSQYKKGFILGFNTGAGIGFNITQKVSLNFELLYTHGICFPHFSKIYSSYYDEYTSMGHTQIFQGKATENHTYKFSNSPRIPINILAVSIGLAYSF